MTLFYSLIYYAGSTSLGLNVANSAEFPNKEAPVCKVEVRTLFILARKISKYRANSFHPDFSDPTTKVNKIAYHVWVNTRASQNSYSIF